MRKIGKLRLNYILYIIAIIPYMGIYGINSSVGSGALYTWQIVGLLLLFLNLLRIRHITINYYCYVFAIYEGIILFSTTLFHGFSMGILVGDLAYFFIIVLLLNDTDDILCSVGLIIRIMIMFNFVTVLMIGPDDYALYFIGGKNKLSMVLIPALFILLVDSYNRFEKLNISMYVYLIIVLLSILIAGSGTGIIVSGFAIFLIVIFTRHELNKKVVLGIVAITYILFLLSTNFLMESKIWLAITSYLGKGTTLSYRTIIWENVRSMVSNSPLIGTGRGSEISLLNVYGGRNIYWEAHNFVMEILLEGGFLALVVYLYGFIKNMIRLDSHNLIEKTILIAILIISVNGLTESINNVFWVVFIIGMSNIRFTKRNNNRR